MLQFELPHHVEPEKIEKPKLQTDCKPGHGLGYGLSQIKLPDAVQKCEGGKRVRGREQRRRQLQDFLDSHDFSDDVCSPRITQGGCFLFPGPRVYPIHVAAHLGDHEIVHLLLQAKADPRQPTSRGRTAEEIALEADRSGSHREVLELLQSQVHVVNFREALDLMQQNDQDGGPSAELIR